MTVQCWIPVRLCTKLDLFSQRLNVSREQGLETLLRLLLEEKDQLAELGVSRVRLALIWNFEINFLAH